MTAQDGLQLLDEDVGRVLAVAAHPDDLEYGPAAAVATWTTAGHEVAYVLATRGEAGIDHLAPEECASVREDEQRRSARVVGVESVEFLHHQDGLLVAGPELRRDLAAAIRRHRPDTVVTVNHRERWTEDGEALNSADHRALGQALLDAVADAGNRWIFRGVGGEPHQARTVLVSGSPRARHAIDVSGAEDRAVASLAEHATYLDGLGDHPMADPELVRWMLADAGDAAGCAAAVRVERFRF